jgi:catechol-2,3-dioxygenase
MAETLEKPIRRRADDAVPVPRRLAHVVLYTAKYEEMRDWYKTVLNAVVVMERPGKQAFMTFDEEHHRILVSHQPDFVDRPAKAARVAHVAWTYSSLSDLFATYRRLEAEGIVPDRRINHGFTTSLYYIDPDGNQNELQVENFDDPDDGRALIEGDRYRNVPIDPDRLSAALDAGVPEAALRDQASLVRMIEAGEI